MNNSERATVLVVGGLVLLGAATWGLRSCGRAPVPLPDAVTPAISTATPAAPLTVAPPPVTPAVTSPRRKTPAGTPNTSATGAPVAPAVSLRKDLIPKDITIVRCYYANEIVPPGTTMGFDINGSGFNAEFEKMITVESGHPGIRVRHLKLVTANQIHGEMVVSPEAGTQFVFPVIKIKGATVFQAPEPFAVIRKGEVLTIVFISMEENGRAGRFRILTNVDEATYPQFAVLPSTAGLSLSDMTPRLPFAVEGTLRIGPQLPPGEYGLRVEIANREVFRRDGMIRIVRPNVGSTGFIQAVMTSEPFYRPGDTLQLYVQGSGFVPENVNDLRATVNEFDMGRGTFTYLNGGQMRLLFQTPTQAPPRTYSISIANQQGASLFEKKDAFTLVPPDWIAGLQVAPPLKAGGASTLRILGRDLTPAFVESLRIDIDEPGITLGALARADANTVTAPISAEATVAPGDYWLQIKAGNRKVSPPFGSIIKVEKP